MRTLLSAAAMTLAVAQSPTSQFAGTWTATLNGKTYVRLELAQLNDDVTGRISLADIHVNADGVVDNILSDLSSSGAIFDVRMRDGVLTFARKDGDQIDRFEM